MAQRDLKVTLIGDDKTGKAFRSAGKGADGFGDKLKKLGTLAAVGLGAAAGAVGVFAKSGVDAFARIEDATGAAGVQFGAGVDDVVKFAEGASKAFGLSKGAALDAANTFGTLGKSAGLQGKPLAAFSTQFAGLAGDLASFKGTSAEQAIEAVGAALRGEAEPIRAYGVLLDDATLRQKALALGLIATTKTALTPQQKVLATQALILEKTKDAQGDFARTSDSTANTQKRLAAETENASARLGEKLAPTVTKVREGFITFIDALSDTEGTFQKKIVPAVQSTVDKLRALGGFIADNRTAFTALGVVVVALTAITKAHAAVMAVQAAGGLLAMLRGTTLVTAVTKTYTAVQWLLNAALTANPIGLVVVAIGLLTAGLVLAYKNSETFRTALQTAFRVVAQAVLDGVSKMLGALASVFEAMSKIPGIGGAFGKVADAIRGAQRRVDGLSDSLDDLGRKKPSPSITLLGVGAAEEALIRLERRITNIGGVQVPIPVRTNGSSSGRSGGAQARANGGPVRAGQPYLVGEREPELFVPRQSGQILNGRQMAGKVGNTYNLTINGSLDRDVTTDQLHTMFRRMELMA